MTEFKNCKPASSYTSLSLDEPVKIRSFDLDQQPITLPQLFEMTVKKCGDHPALVSQDADKNWITLTYQDYWNKTRQIARAFIKLGLKPRTSCGILAISRPEWFLTQMATVFVGGVSAGIYVTNSAEATYHILSSSSALICVVEDSAQMAKVRSVRDRLPNLKSIIQMQGPYEDFVDSEEGYYSWSQMMAIGLSDEKSLESQLEERLKNVYANECITLIYTSGTVGMPKGVMISHDNIIRFAISQVDSMPNINYGHEVIVSYLPMNHVGAQTLDFFMTLVMGGCIYFADRDALKGSLLKTVIKAQPTIFFAVPRIYEKIQAKLMAAERELPWIYQFILSTARNTVQSYHPAIVGVDSKPMSSWMYWLAAKISRKALLALGFSRCSTYFTGAAPVDTELKKYFLGYDIKISEVYGISECSGMVTVVWDLDDFDSSGKPLSNIQLRLHNADENGNGELCVRSRMIFMGYLDEPEKTKEAITEDGWFHTGDIAYIDSKGRVHISGRIKEILVTSGGENIPPVRIENLIRAELPGLSNAMVIGDRHKFLTVLVTIKTEVYQDSGRPCDILQPESLEWMKSLGLPYATLTEILNAGPCPRVLQSIQEGIDRANANAISHAQRVQKFFILPHDFSIPTGELGPTLKLRRNIVIEKYADVIEQLYKGT